MLAKVLAVLYAVMAALPAGMHLLLACGAPLGRFSVGGRFPGCLPPPWRALALVQAALLAGMAFIVISHAGVVDIELPSALVWLVLALTILTLCANAASPSAPERQLWVPVISVMTLSLLGVMTL